jgi:Carboxypeptidase regulatory-like domain
VSINDFRISARLLAVGGALVLAAVAWAQSSAVGLRGVVTDSSGSYVPGAKVTLNGPDGTKVADADAMGAYRFLNLAPGDYTVQASAPQLTQGAPAKITLTTGVQVLNLRLSIETVVQTVTVDDNAAPTVSTDAASNASAVVLSGSDLEAVADNPEDMLADLQALAGPSAGPNGGSVFVDGFSGGELPPKESIREVRINSNPFSPEYDKLGFGRIEITTKPGADRFRGNLNYNLGSDVWNSRNPYSAVKAPLLLNEWENTISGPLGKRTSFALDANQNNVDNGAIVNAVVLDPSLAASPLFQNYKMIQRRTRLNPRIDRQLSANNTISLCYQYTRGDLDGLGIGGFNLTSRGYHTKYLLQTVQLMDTIVHGPAVYDLRFRYYRNAAQAEPASTDPATQVLGSFTSGGSSLGASHDTFNGYESHNDPSVVHGAHLFKFGVRIRDEFDNNMAPTNFNGTFTFSGGLAPQLNANNQLVLDATGQPVLISINSLEQYRRTLFFQRQGLSMSQIRTLGGGPTQFNITTGTPATDVSQFDIGTYFGDDWRMRPNLTLSYGLRYEVQTNIDDHQDFAPRVGLAWAPGGNAKSAKTKTVLRAGFGIFYDRFFLANSLTAARYNGTVQQQYVVD